MAKKKKEEQGEEKELIPVDRRTLSKESMLETLLTIIQNYEQDTANGRSGLVRASDALKAIDKIIQLENLDGGKSGSMPDTFVLKLA